MRRAVLDSPEFKALWERIKHRTTYRVAFDNEKLITELRRLGDVDRHGAPGGGVHRGPAVRHRPPVRAADVGRTDCSGCIARGAAWPRGG